MPKQKEKLYMIDCIHYNCIYHDCDFDPFQPGEMDIWCSKNNEECVKCEEYCPTFYID